MKKIKDREILKKVKGGENITKDENYIRLFFRNHASKKKPYKQEESGWNYLKS